MAASTKSSRGVPAGISEGEITGRIRSPSTRTAAGRIPCGVTTRRETKACGPTVAPTGNEVRPAYPEAAIFSIRHAGVMYPEPAYRIERKAPAFRHGDISGN